MKGKITISMATVVKIGHHNAITMGDLAVDRPTWWRWAYLGL